MLPDGENAEEAFALEAPLVCGVELVIQPRAVVVPQAELKQARPVRVQVLAFRVKSPHHEVAETPVVCAVDEPGFCVKARRYVPVHGVELERARAALCIDLVSRAGNV